MSKILNSNDNDFLCSVGEAIQVYEGKVKIGFMKFLIDPNYDYLVSDWKIVKGKIKQEGNLVKVEGTGKVVILNCQITN